MKGLTGGKMSRSIPESINSFYEPESTIRKNVMSGINGGKMTQEEQKRLVFSSRRRHTSYIGDWSSDVCSSDLTHSKWVRVAQGRVQSFATSMSGEFYALLRQRSEERRVGRECKSWGSLPHLNERTHWWEDVEKYTRKHQFVL